MDAGPLGLGGCEAVRRPASSDRRRLGCVKTLAGDRNNRGPKTLSRHEAAMGDAILVTVAMLAVAVAAWHASKRWPR